MSTVTGTWSHNFSHHVPRIHVSETFIRRFANFMLIMSIINLIPLILKCHRVYKTGCADEFSMKTLFFQLTLSVLWVFNALITGNAGVLFTTSLAIIITLILIFLVWRCRRQGNKHGHGKYQRKQ